MYSYHADAHDQVKRTVRRFVRSPNLVAYWKDGAFVLEEFVRRRRISVAPYVVPLLLAFEKPRTIPDAARGFSRFERRSVERGLQSLADLGFLQVVGAKRPMRDLFQVWEESFPAVYYQFASKDIPYITDTSAKVDYVRGRLAEAPQPRFHKTYPKAKQVSVPETGSERNTSLEAVLRQRRTVREFGRGRVRLSDFGTLIRGTWGQTGFIDADPLGRLVVKTSPSAGARHPIECYVVAWKVEDLPAGLYHYSVRRDRLEQLRLGDFRAEAVRMASKQQWIRGAAFLCIMTAVTDRVFWKYRLPDAYRVFFLDAGHLAQTFALLATSLGLGSFTTAALQETRIERFCGLDGVQEFPVYLCGAGVPTPRPSSSTRAADPIPSSRP
jgi:SagB-type dehydrogenase family enzyme